MTRASVSVFEVVVLAEAFGTFRMLCFDYDLEKMANKWLLLVTGLAFASADLELLVIEEIWPPPAFIVVVPTVLTFGLTVVALSTWCGFVRAIKHNFSGGCTG